MGADRIIRAYAVTHGPGPVRFPQDGAWHEFVYASEGVVRLETEAGAWTLPPERGLWVHAGVEHRATVVQRAAMRTLYLPEPLPLLPDAVTVVEMTPLVRALVLRLVARAPVALDESGAAWLHVLRDEIHGLDVSPVSLPAVRSDLATAVAELLAQDPGRDDSVEALARAVGASRRSVERAFREDTGLSVGEWRRRLRLIHALELLASGVSVGRVAVETGYATQSAFGAMFKAHFGIAPGAYFDRRS